MAPPQASPSAEGAAEPSSSTSVHVKPYDAASDAAPTARQLAEMEEDDHEHEDEDDADLEELEKELDENFDLGGFRERRMEELKSQMQEIQKMRQSDFGKYNEYTKEKDVISATAKASRSLVHFYHRDFRRCKIMDSHLEKLAKKHFDTLFIKIDVANAPFLVTKMDVKVLPCVIGFVKAVSKLKIVGFEELPGGDNFTTSALEFGLIQADVIKDPKLTATASRVIGTARSSGSSNSASRGIRSSSRIGASNDESDLDD
ncbi:BZ3500_MvSof-1268-A1-R1_Chr1-3g01969 [Microbotryum saponariae]|uniref:BZ3500_MvSof-1268-A1-R1_Chr1-3g01969 protein n=1 Tax=Microbotryum saponariae TaxID=289078 RepID=A0A2X0KHP1_9BASI|nr:BZ3500_MvSof-1268-A1-R1_Chr1-3g01969 [Microbotryum saponariae]SCZ95051.1 BZ3501_MvSof-1269-A2-R1_Chr1-3g01571 [Microbotryum saponariae]